MILRSAGRVRWGLSAVTCAGAALGAAASCVDSTSDPAPFQLDGSTLDTGTPDTSVPAVDAAPIDAATPDTAVPEAAPPDAGCQPSLGAFTPPPYVPANGQTFISECAGHAPGFALAVACLGDASSLANCDGFADAGLDGGPVAPQCVACLRSPADAGADGGYGPLIDGVVATPNVAGCIEMADRSDAGIACAQAVQAAARCVEAACKTSCPVTDEASRQAYLGCTKLAATTACSAFTAPATACLAAEQDAGSTAATFCLGSGALEDQFATLAAFFCYS